jgi:hypothetical protein
LAKHDQTKNYYQRTQDLLKPKGTTQPSKSGKPPKGSSKPHKNHGETKDK